ncbi:MAG: hypothetical protein K6T63_00430 [Alicyclobacillus herbarius]|uniref:hypothetical protein n=1 Tax=Alicyclobacillus herbarius TaxID=122960 RepID=UPI0023539E3B|nr:hypothetical protein [Alicyclobacillus herbarius]MCL6631070.1 hypothetical protein [Alicyclobacillus herbarius]
MNDELDTLRYTMKRLLAAIVFVCFLVGAGAGVFAALAAGMSALSDFSGPRAVPAATVPSAASTPSSSAAGIPASPSGQSPSESGSGSASGFASGSSQQAVHPGLSQVGGPDSTAGSTQTTASSGTDSVHGRFYSPVGEAIDQGGVVLGDKVQQGFGHLLAKVLHVLFLEQPAGVSEPAASPAGQRSAVNGGMGDGNSNG